MKKRSIRRKRRLTERVELGRHIVADPEICHGKPTIKGTRVMVRQILEELAQGMSPDDIIGAWAGKISQAAIAECIQLAHQSLLDKDGQLLNPELALSGA